MGKKGKRKEEVGRILSNSNTGQNAIVQCDINIPLFITIIPAMLQGPVSIGWISDISGTFFLT